MTRTILLSIFVMAALVISAMWFASAAQAQLACDTRASVIEKLGKVYGETRRGGGLSGPTAIFEIWASNKDERSWTILKTSPDGISCILAVGDGWHDDTAPVKPELMAGEPV